VPGEGKFGNRGEDPHPDVAATGRREDEDGLGDVHLPGQALHLGRSEGPAVDEHAELVSLERLGSEDIAHEVRMKLRRSLPVREARDNSMLDRHPVHSILVRNIVNPLYDDP